jgi:phospholipid transport system transporter-binding protein
LTFATVTGILEQSRGLFAQADEVIEVELGAVERVDSAGLALLIEWLRLARDMNKSIRFSQLPEQMKAIAAACDLDSILPLA